MKTPTTQAPKTATRAATRRTARLPSRAAATASTRTSTNTAVPTSAFANTAHALERTDREDRRKTHGEVSPTKDRKMMLRRPRIRAVEPGVRIVQLVDQGQAQHQRDQYRRHRQHQRDLSARRVACRLATTH